jgi:hypothetical protein
MLTALMVLRRERQPSLDIAATHGTRPRFSETGPAPYVQLTQTLVQKEIIDLEFDEISFLVGTTPD